VVAGGALLYSRAVSDFMDFDLSATAVIATYSANAANATHQ
jgi:hypothetical protein